ncbi:RcnB family protein [Acinetobacter sp. ULE_I010]|uniref:RcnB family protein n=1 Tax=Acinetobacter sp. ULE_I010 TaxID=3373065 RepID=UPI003AF96696
MKQILSLSVLMLMLSGTSIMVWADAKDWGNYRSVERPQKRYPTTTYKYTDQYGRQMSQEIPIRPPSHRPYPSYPSYPNYPNRPYPNYPTPSYPSQNYPPQNGVTIIYNHQFPTRTEYSGSSYGYVNGEGGHIESSQYTLISDWRRYGLPDPQAGMHWIFQNGRYLQVPNNR